MEEGKIIENVRKEEYLRVVSRIDYYMKSKNISAIFKYKCPTFALAGLCDVEERIYLFSNSLEERIYLFSNSLEEMGSFYGLKGIIWCLCSFSNRILASGSDDHSIKIWDIEERAIISTLSGHTNTVTTLCYVREGVFVSGSWDKSLIIWSKLPGSNIYSQQLLTGHTSQIRGIIRINNSEIVSGDYYGDKLLIWNIDQGLCTRQLPRMHSGISQMKQHMGEVAVSYWEIIWGAANNWGAPLRQFSVCKGLSIEFLSEDILLRGGGHKGELEFIDCAQIGCSMPPIQGLHSSVIYEPRI